MRGVVRPIAAPGFPPGASRQFNVCHDGERLLSTEFPTSVGVSTGLECMFLEIRPLISRTSLTIAINAQGCNRSYKKETTKEKHSNDDDDDDDGGRKGGTHDGSNTVSVFEFHQFRLITFCCPYLDRAQPISRADRWLGAEWLDVRTGLRLPRSDIDHSAVFLSTLTHTGAPDLIYPDQRERRTG
ncbi:hypothetical protein K0M31_010345 [Melipona bicolor]|uniref:Uncharacterized protein n=1 Tax=Melipona bicolor TaxID=60889 RepID=A0AA40FLY9_9HYME|nr:hypothetical protein K0M31_010345 [Melipona bicolor]